MLHACVVEYRGRAYAFTAPSGTGKSTHASLWMRYLAPAASVLNGDKPLVHVPPTGGIVVWGTPWTGKEGWGRNVRAPLAGICPLHRADACRAEAVPPRAALTAMLRQCYIPSSDPAAATAALACINRLLARVPAYSLGCDMSEAAVRVAFEALTGLPYPACPADSGSRAPQPGSPCG